MPKFEANMNYIPPTAPSSMKQCNKSATVKFHIYGTTFHYYYYDPEAISHWCHTFNPIAAIAQFLNRHCYGKSLLPYCTSFPYKINT